MNTVPGRDLSPTPPGGLYHFGLRAIGGTVPLGTVEAYVGSTDVRHHGTSPELDALLGAYGLAVSLHSVERQLPESAAMGISTSQGRLLLTRTENGDLTKCVYELKLPIDTNASLLGYLRVRKKSWTLRKPNWCWLDGIAGLYFGLLHGQYNAPCFTFFQNSDHVIVAGALPSLSGPRVFERSIDFGWQALSTDAPIEIWICFNVPGFPLPTVPSNVPTVDVWLGAPNIPPSRVARIPVSYFGQMQGRAEEQYATLFIGNAGQAGDVVDIEDWALFPDYRTAMLAGNTMVGASVLIKPDSPLTYQPSTDLVAPHSLKVARWFISSDAGSVTPSIGFGYQPGRKSAPQTVILTKPAGSGHVAFERDEPQLGGTTEGFMMEAFVAGHDAIPDGVTTGMGIEADDGTSLYRLVMIENADGKTFGISLSGDQRQLINYHQLPQEDFTSLKFVRMIFDRPRNKLLVYFDDKRVANLTVGQDVLLSNASSGSGRLRLGHIIDSSASGGFALALLNVHSRYLAYEAEDGQLPPVAATPLTMQKSGNGTAEMGMSQDGGEPCLLISKPDMAVPSTKATFFTSYDLASDRGGFVEMRVRIPFYTDFYGTPLAKNTFTGVGLRLHLGDRYLQFGFYDAGINGRVAGLLLGSGTDGDIFKQTVLGRKSSIQIDWTEWQTYRIHYRAFDAIKIWAGSVVSDPTIVIPWGGPFDLPLQTSTEPGLEFGHLGSDQASSSEWAFVRWGASSGYDIAIEQVFPSGPKDYQYSGKSMYQLTFGDGVGGGGEVLTPADPPVFSIGGGSYTGAINVSASSPTPGAVIRYTVDGSTPNDSSQVFPVSLPIASNMILKAITTAPGYANSTVTFATYTIT